ncbi:MAG: ferredoxin domain-containing protein [Candidatus Bathyarchaeia archaeon]
MPVLREDGEKEGILEAAKLMLISARTAPKSGGVDDLVVVVVYGREKDEIVIEMEKIAEERGNEGFVRDGKNLSDSDVVLLVGVKGPKSFGLNCGACGYETCEAFQKAGEKQGQDFVGPMCLFKALDLGIALGSAAKTASILNVDNRIMYRIGTAAKRLGLLPQAQIIMGIPLCAAGKNIYFDRSKKT